MRRGRQAAPPVAERGGVFVELLRLMPDRPEVRAYVEMGDVKRAREALGVEAPPEAVDGKFNTQGLLEYFQALIPPVSVGNAPPNAGRSPAVAPQFFLAGSDRGYTGV